MARGQGAALDFTSKEFVEKRDELLEDYAGAIEKCFPVENKYEGGRLTEWKLNAGQQKLHKLWERIRQWNWKKNADNPLVHKSVKDGPVRIIVLKDRSEGFSSYVQARFTLRAKLTDSYNVGVMAHLEKVTENILRKGAIYNNEWRGPPELNLKMKSASDSEIEWLNYSRLVAATAGSKGMARSYTFHAVHGSEVAHFPSFVGFNAMLNTMPDWADVILESTACGEGGYFHNVWQKAMYFDDVVKMYMDGDEAAKDKWNGYFRLFFGWHENPKNRLELTSKQAMYIRSTMTEAEREYRKMFDLDAGQLAWRRNVIKTKCQGEPGMEPEDYFRQEYPAFAEEAFVGRGSRYFSLRGMAQQQAWLEQEGRPLLAALLLPEGLPITTEGGAENLVIMEAPAPGHRYIASLDPAQGSGDDGDEAVIRVWDVTFTVRRCVAKWVSRSVESWEQADILCVLGELYGHGLITWESNNHGQSVGFRVLQNQYNPVFRAMSHNKANPSIMADLGINMKGNSRTAALGALQRGIRDGTVALLDPIAIHQYKQFRIINAKAQAPSGEHDDYVMADAVAIYADEQTPNSPVVSADTPEARAAREGQCWQGIVRKVNASEKQNRRALKKQRAPWFPREVKLPPSR